MKPKELYYNTPDPVPILHTKFLKQSSQYGGVSLSANKNLKAHGPFKLVFKKFRGFKQLSPLFYLKPVVKKIGKIDHYIDQFGKTYSVEEFNRIPLKNKSSLRSGAKVMRGNVQFANEQEWYSLKDLEFSLRDIVELIVMINAPDYNKARVKKTLTQMKQEFPSIPIRFDTASPQKQGIFNLKKTSSSLFKSSTIKTKKGPRDLEIFINPDKSDIREILYAGDTPYVNFFIDFRHKAVYIWNGKYASHADVAPLIPLDMHLEETVSGIAEILYPEYRLNPLALYQGKRDFDSFEWDWLDKYLRRISNEYNMIAKKKIK